MAQFLWYDCTFKKQCTVPVTLTYEYTGLYDCYIFYNIIDNFMRISNSGMGVYMSKSNIDVFLWRHFSARSSFYCFIE